MRPFGRVTFTCTSFRMKLATKGLDQFGGVPPRVTANAWPTCSECERPLTHVLTLKAHAERVPLKKHGALSVFVCTNEETAGQCEVWDAEAGSNATPAIAWVSQRAMVRKRRRTLM